MLDFEKERWIDGQEGRYSVTRDGEVMSHIKGKYQPLKGTIIYRTGNKDYKTYRVVCLTDNSGGSYVNYVHRLVAEAFIPTVEGKTIINHKDGDKLNNSVDNLEWCTHSENTQHAVDAGLMKYSRGLRPKTMEQILNSLQDLEGKIKLSSNTLRIFPDDLLVEYGIPSEIKTTQSKEGSWGITWRYYCDLFTLCDSWLSLSQISFYTGMDISAISLIRNGKRLAKARLVYDKYKDDSRFFKNYTPLFSYPDNLKLKNMLNSLKSS